MIEIRQANGEPLPFRAAARRRYKVPPLRGAVMEVAEGAGFVLQRCLYEHANFRIELYHYGIDCPTVFTLTDKSLYLRLQAVVRGAVRIKFPDGSESQLLTGECQCTRAPHYQLSAETGELLLLYCYLSPGFVAQQAAGALLVEETKLFLSPYEAGLIDRLFHNPFAAPFQAGYYECLLRELLFLYTATPRTETLHEARANAAIYAAANLISTNLHHHYSISELARLVHTNADEVKKGFQRIYKMGPYAWRLQIKMERAQLLLQSTDEPIQAIANLTGYADAASFVREFKKRVGVPPKLWRREQRKNV